MNCSVTKPITTSQHCRTYFLGGGGWHGVMAPKIFQPVVNKSREEFQDLTIFMQIFASSKKVSHPGDSNVLKCPTYSMGP